MQQMSFSLLLLLPVVQVHQGRQAIPLFRLPLIIRAQRKFSYNNAMLEFSVTHADGEPGALPNPHPCMILLRSLACTCTMPLGMLTAE
eukprot:scaffold26743_cov21-Tisochrysis_lutea.AAC.1